MCLVACGQTQQEGSAENNEKSEGKSGMDILIDQQGIERPSDDTVNVLKGKRALFVGDSIMAGVCDYNTIFGGNSWPSRIGYFCDMTVTNNGVSGASGASSKCKMWLYHKLQDRGTANLFGYHKTDL